MKREPIEAVNAKADYLKCGKWCRESKVRELEAYTSSLERKLKIAEEALERISVDDSV